MVPLSTELKRLQRIKGTNRCSITNCRLFNMARKLVVNNLSGQYLLMLTASKFPVISEL
jgi:hypothetical protein